MLALAALATPALAQTGICGRTAVVQTFILAEIEGVSACADVTGTHLAAITGSLLLNSESITALAAGDFAGLTSLTNLYLNNNELTALPAGVFAGLTALTELTLFDNVLIALPADVFEPLTSLTSLQLQRNDLATLPAGVFDALTALTDLQLHGNDLTTLPADVFEPLTALTEQLYLDDNPGAPFAPVAVALPDDGTVSSAGGTVRLDGSGSDGGPWGEYVTYSWALTNPSSGVTVTFDDAGSATPVVTIPALAANTELTFTLTVAGRSGSDGVTRGTDAARVTATTVPGAPTGLTATASGTTAINLSWSAPASTGGSAITGYKIESSSDGGSSWSDLVANTSNTTTTYAHTGLTAGDTRHYRVSAINTNGTGVPSNVANATTGATAPGAPTGLTATASGTTAINLSWSAPASTGGSAITGYNIEVSPNGTSGWTDQVANTGNANTTYAHTGLTAGTTRHYRVSAINANGTGVPSNVDSATTGTTVPGAPTGLTATASGTTAINLSWSAPASTGGSAITGYKIEVSPDGSSWSDLVADTGSTDTAYAHMGLDPATTRHYRVSTINAVGTSDASDSASTTTASTNTAATGAPTITGTAQVGQVLTATVGTIADVDGLPDPFFSDAATTIAWIRVATDNTETNIASATASTYTLGAADLGTTIKVRVSFTDDASNAETLTSADGGRLGDAPPDTTPPTLTSATVWGGEPSSSSPRTFRYSTSPRGSRSLQTALRPPPPPPGHSHQRPTDGFACHHQARRRSRTPPATTPPPSPPAWTASPVTNLHRHQHPRDGRADDHGHGAGRRRCGGHHRHHGCRRADQRQLHVPVDPDRCRRGYEHLRGDGEHLHAGGGRPGHDGQGEGELHRRRQQSRDAHQRGDGGRRGGAEHRGDGRADDHGHGAGRADADGGHHRHRGCRRADQRQLHVPVDPGGHRQH